MWLASLTTNFTTGSTISSHVSAPLSDTHLSLALNTTAPPDDHSRVVLKEVPGMEGSDYINASFIDVSCKQREKTMYHDHMSLLQGYGDKKHAYIAAQGKCTMES